MDGHVSLLEPKDGAGSSPLLRNTPFAMNIPEDC